VFQAGLFSANRTFPAIAAEPAWLYFIIEAATEERGDCRGAAQSRPVEIPRQPRARPHRRTADNMTDDGSLGSHPHSDRPNWQPAETLDDYARNCREGLEDDSDRRAAQLLGWSRMAVYRAKLMAGLPDELFERLLDAGVDSPKALANVALALQRNDRRSADVDRCPHCGGVLQVRYHLSKKALTAIAEWLASLPAEREHAQEPRVERG